MLASLSSQRAAIQDPLTQLDSERIVHTKHGGAVEEPVLPVEAELEARAEGKAEL